MCILVIYDYFAHTSTTNFYQNLQKIFFTSTSIGKWCHKYLETNLIHFVLAQFHSKKTMGQSPCFDIEYIRSYVPFLSENCSGAKYKTFTLTFLIFDGILFLLDQFQPHQFQPHHPSVISTIHMVILKQCCLHIH